MPHEFRNLQEQPHAVLTYILAAGGFIGLVMVLLAVYLRWKHPKLPKEPTSKGAGNRSHRKRRRKR